MHCNGWQHNQKIYCSLIVGGYTQETRKLGNQEIYFCLIVGGYTQAHGSLKVHGGVHIVLCIFVDPL